MKYECYRDVELKNGKLHITLHGGFHEERGYWLSNEDVCVKTTDKDEISSYKNLGREEYLRKKNQSGFEKFLKASSDKNLADDEREKWQDAFKVALGKKRKPKYNLDAVKDDDIETKGKPPLRDDYEELTTLKGVPAWVEDEEDDDEWTQELSRIFENAHGYPDTPEGYHSPERDWYYSIYKKEGILDDCKNPARLFLDILNAISHATEVSEMYDMIKHYETKFRIAEKEAKKRVEALKTLAKVGVIEKPLSEKDKMNFFDLDKIPDKSQSSFEQKLEHATKHLEYVSQMQDFCQGAREKAFLIENHNYARDGFISALDSLYRYHFGRRRRKKTDIYNPKTKTGWIKKNLELAGIDLTEDYIETLLKRFRKAARNRKD